MATMRLKIPHVLTRPHLAEERSLAREVLDEHVLGQAFHQRRIILRVRGPCVDAWVHNRHEVLTVGMQRSDEVAHVLEREVGRVDGEVFVAVHVIDVNPLCL